MFLYNLMSPEKQWRLSLFIIEMAPTWQALHACAKTKKLDAHTHEMMLKVFDDGKMLMRRRNWCLVEERALVAGAPTADGRWVVADATHVASPTHINSPHLLTATCLPPAPSLHFHVQAVSCLLVATCLAHGLCNMPCM